MRRMETEEVTRRLCSHSSREEHFKSVERVRGRKIGCVAEHPSCYYIVGGWNGLQIDSTVGRELVADADDLPRGEIVRARV
jgi:hypothetical protein